MTNDEVPAGEGARPPRFAQCGATAILAITAVIALAAAAAAQEFPPQQIEAGAKIFARNCSPCHGARMRDPEGAFDLRKFPHDAHDRFIASVTRGKNQMPPWGDLLKPDEVEALWAYVVAGEK
jgi:mono/diheme cytochrome c family protein